MDFTFHETRMGQAPATNALLPCSCHACKGDFEEQSFGQLEQLAAENMWKGIKTTALDKLCLGILWPDCGGRYNAQSGSRENPAALDS